MRLSMGWVDSNREGDSVRIMVLPTCPDTSEGQNKTVKKYVTTAAAPNTQRNILSSTIATIPQSWSSWAVLLYKILLVEEG